MIRRPAALTALVALAVLIGSGCAVSALSADATVVVHYSRFEPETIEVPAGVPVTITLRNDDPIDHEWIVGPPEVHERHRTGTEPVHDTVPTEVTIPALSTRVTTLTFDHAVEYQYICHLPGHEAYGMVGTLRVVER